MLLALAMKTLALCMRQCMVPWVSLSIVFDPSTQVCLSVILILSHLSLPRGPQQVPGGAKGAPIQQFQQQSIEVKKSPLQRWGGVGVKNAHNSHTYFVPCSAPQWFQEPASKQDHKKRHRNLILKIPYFHNCVPFCLRSLVLYRSNFSGISSFPVRHVRQVLSMDHFLSIVIPNCYLLLKHSVFL